MEIKYFYNNLEKYLNQIKSWLNFNIRLNQSTYNVGKHSMLINICKKYIYKNYFSVKTNNKETYLFLIFIGVKFTFGRHFRPLFVWVWVS